jgi:membrane protein DedA with SNARE-associated domain
LLGYLAGENRDLINTYSHELSYLFIAIAILLLIWLIVKTTRKKK